MKYLILILLLLAGCQKKECLQGHIYQNFVLTDNQMLIGCGAVIYGTITISGKSVVVRNLEIVGENKRRSGIRIISKSENILIENVRVHGFKHAGIESVGGWPNKDIHRVTIRNCVVYDNPGDPEYTENWSGSGIVLGDCVDCLIENCEAYNNGELSNSKNLNGPFGIWYYNSENSVIINSVSHHNKTRQGHYDGGGFDLDGGCVNCRIGDCRSYNNMGAGYMVWHFTGSTPTRDLYISGSSSINDLIGIMVDRIEGEVVFEEMYIQGEIGYIVNHSKTTIKNSILCVEYNEGNPILENNNECL